MTTEAERAPSPGCGAAAMATVAVIRKCAVSDSRECSVFHRFDGLPCQGGQASGRAPTAAFNIQQERRQPPLAAFGKPFLKQGFNADQVFGVLADAFVGYVDAVAIGADLGEDTAHRGTGATSTSPPRYRISGPAIAHAVQISLR